MQYYPPPPPRRDDNRAFLRIALAVCGAAALLLSGAGFIWTYGGSRLCASALVAAFDQGHCELVTTLHAASMVAGGLGVVAVLAGVLLR